MLLRRWGSYGYDDGDVQAIEQWLAQSQPVFAALRRGANTPHCWPIYDSGKYDSTESAPIAEMVIANLHKNVANAQRTIRTVAGKLPADRSSSPCDCSSAVAHAIITDPATIPTSLRERYALLLDKYLVK